MRRSPPPRCAICALGLVFAEERHGNGPVHRSCGIGETVLEIYPGEAGRAGEPPAGATMTGFRVASLDEVLQAIREIGGAVVSGPAAGEWGRRVVVQDPDGRAVEIVQSVG